MGNINVDTPIAAPTAAEVIFESSLASDLQARAQAFIDSLISGGAGLISSADIAGAGDGYAFVLSVLYEPAGPPPAAGTLIRVYEAASEPELNAAGAAALATLAPSLQVSAFGMSGSSAGRRWMGVLVAEPIPPPPPP